MALNDPTGQPLPLKDGEFTSASHPSEVTFNLRNLAPPSPQYIRPDEQLFIAVWNSRPDSATMEIDWRFLLTNGQLQAGEQQIPITADRQRSFGFIPLPEGYLLNLNAQANFTSFSTPQYNRGQTFVKVSIVRGSPPTSGPQVALLASGYTARNLQIGWPGGRQDSSLEGPGWVHSVQQANPLAGNDWIYTVPANARQRVQSLASVLTTSATAGSRNVSLIVDDGANVVWQHDLAASIPVSTIEVVTATSTNAPTGVIATTQAMVLPPGIVLEPGHRIRTSTANISATDQWSAIWLLLEEWISP